MDPSLYEVLNNTKIRLNITCSGDTNSCLEFTTNFTDATPYNYTAPLEFTDTCYHGFSTGELTRFVTVPAASPVGPTTSSTLGFNKSIILAGKADQGLPWSEGFDDAGNEKDDKFWGDWWDTTHRRYGGLNTDDDSDDDSDSDSDEGWLVSLMMRKHVTFLRTTYDMYLVGGACLHKPGTLSGSVSLALLSAWHIRHRTTNRM